MRNSEETESGQGKESCMEAEPGHLLQALMRHWVHEDILFWSNIRYLLATQLALYAAWYALGTSILSAIVMLVSAIVSYVLMNLAGIVRSNRDVNLEGAIKKLFKASSLHARLRFIPRLTTHELSLDEDLGWKFHKRVFLGAITLNVLIVFITLHDVFRDPNILDAIHPSFVAINSAGFCPDFTDTVMVK